VIVTPGRRERARREVLAQRRRQLIAAIREPSLKSGVITVGSGFGGTGKTDVAVTLAAIYAAARPADRVILADSNDDMPHGYIRLGGTPVEGLPQQQRPLSLRGFYQACRQREIEVYADLRDAVAWLQGVAVIRGDTADECAGVDFGELEYQAVLEFLQCMSNVVINDGGTGLFAKLQVGTLLHGDKYVFVTEASQLGFWSIDQVFSRYRNYAGDKERPLTEQERKHLTGLMDEATVVVDKFADNDPGQAKWYAQICERFTGTHVSVVATPWDHALGQPGAPGPGRCRCGHAGCEAGDGRRGAPQCRSGPPQASRPPHRGGRRHWQQPAGPSRPATLAPRACTPRSCPRQPRGADHTCATRRAPPRQPGRPRRPGRSRRLARRARGADHPRATPAHRPASPATPAAPSGPGDWPEDSDVRIIPAQPQPDPTDAGLDILGPPDEADARSDGPPCRPSPRSPSRTQPMPGWTSWGRRTGLSRGPTARRPTIPAQPQPDTRMRGWTSWRRRRG
jgi:hypothetical protein